MNRQYTVLCKSVLLLITLLSMTSLKVGAQNRYVVFFSDKNATPYRIDNPTEYLSARAISRRQKQGIAITSQDLPVNPAYVDGVRSLGAETFFTTKWMNGVLIQAQESLINSIESLTYVDSVVFVAPGSKLTSNGRKGEIEELAEELAETDTQVKMLGVDALHDKGYKGEGIIMAIFDGGFTGVNTVDAFKHIYDGNRLIYAKNLVNNNNNVYQYSNHGTKVLSAIAGLVSSQFEGTAYNADISLFITEDGATEYRIEEYNWLMAAEMADSLGVDIINGSLGYYDFDDVSMNYTYKDMDGKTTIVSQAAKLASDRGMLVVVSAGNEGNKAWKYITAPADAENILSVGSVTSKGLISDFSSIGPSADGRIKPEVMAMGSSTVLVNEAGIVSNSSGTSFATPLLAGFAACMWQAYPDLTNLELIDFILQNSTLYANPNNRYGYGIPNYKFIISNISEDNNTGTSAYPNPLFGDELNITTASRGEVRVKLYSPQGKLLFENSMDREHLTYDTSNLKAGVYILTVEANKETSKFRIIKY